MDKKLISALNNISELDYIMLGYRIQTANMCRSIQKQFNIDNATMAKRLDLSPLKFKHFINGGYDYSIRDWAVLQSIQMEYGSAKLEKEIKEQIKVTNDNTKQ